MSSFTNPLIVRVEQFEHKGRGIVTLMEPFDYHIGYKGSGKVITVPAGFQTDGVSVPGIFKIWFPVLGLAGKAAVVHDYMLYTGEYTRDYAAEVFLEAMEVLNVPKLKRTCMYLAVKYWPWVSAVEQWLI